LWTTFVAARREKCIGFNRELLFARQRKVNLSGRAGGAKRNLNLPCRHQRHLDRKYSPFTGRTLNTNSPPMLLDDIPRDVQTKSQPGDVPVAAHAFELLKNPLVVSGRYPDAMIFDHDPRDGVIFQ